MSKHKQTHTPNLDAITEDVRTLMTATHDAIGEKVEAARERLSTALESGEEIYGEVRKAAARGAKTADKLVRKNPYQSLALAFGAGALLIYLLSRRNQD